jgi:hypothetical protein
LTFRIIRQLATVVDYVFHIFTYRYSQTLAVAYIAQGSHETADLHDLDVLPFGFAVCAIHQARSLPEQ